MPKKPSRTGEKLGEYREKRTADATNEPFGNEVVDPREGTLSGAYVVHLHDATRRHYDLRLDVGGVLASFAVPRGPSLDPAEKHLAVKTEDHPIEYLEFEDVIPAKQYGAGPMIAWDRGLVEYLEGPVNEEIARGKIDFRLRGMKLRGRFALVKLAKSVKGDEWLLFKKADEHAAKDRVITTELPRSIFSGLTVEEIEQRDAIGEAIVAKAKKLGAAKRKGDFALAAFGNGVGAKGCVYDAVLDGVRVLATREGDVVTLCDETGAPVEELYPEVVRALRALSVSQIVLDGQIVSFDPTGHPRRALLAERVTRFAGGDGTKAAVELPVVLVATDVLGIGGLDTRSLPLDARREVLSALLPALGFVRTSAPLDGDERRLLASCTALGIAGIVKKPRASGYGEKWVFLRSDAAITDVEVGHAKPKAKVTLSNQTKVFWPEDGTTKGDLCAYYDAIAPVLLPYLARRPVILVRYPDGIAGKHFYQWNVPAGMPAWVRTLSLADEENPNKRGFLIDDRETLLYIANLGCIPVHILASRAEHLANADFLTMDFDIKQSTFENAVRLVRTLHEVLLEIGLPGFPKTSGQTGLHVLVGLGPGQSFDTARALADLLGKILVDRHPAIATMERVVKKRGPKVYVDTGQTGTSRAIVAPYSVRAVAGARVSTPLAWDEVGVDPGSFTIATVPRRVARAKSGDPMASLLAETPDVVRAVARLAEILNA